MKTLVLLISFVLNTMLAFPQTGQNSLIVAKGYDKITVIQPTGETKDSLPVMQLLSDTTELYRKVQDLVPNTFLMETLELYFLASNYLLNGNAIDHIEPAYLALTQKDGGFAKRGFYLETDDGMVEKSEVPYIDIMARRFEGNPNKLMSVTQLYPHEMGHLLYGMLNGTKTDETSRSVDMHYFSLRTDYSTAFNEGFSEHIENISRLNERNDSIKEGIQADLEMIEKKSQNVINGFERDLKQSLRMGYFKMTMPIWYQQYEDYKRHDHAISGRVKYRNETLDLSNIEDRLMYRNSGVRIKEGEPRNYVQMLATEGLVSAFLTRLTQSELSRKFQEPSFYTRFLRDTAVSINNPSEVFSPIQNQFMKYFHVFHQQMTDEKYTQAQLIDFLEGYFVEFPDEEEGVKEIFLDVTGLEYTPELPPDLWLLIKGHDHRLLVLDPFDAITMPAYTFDINGGDVEDYMTIKGIQEAEAESIISYRQSNGFFTSLNQLESVDGLSKESLTLIINSEFDPEYFEGMSIPDLTFSALLTTPLKKLIVKLLVYFLLIFGVVYSIFLHKKRHSFKVLSSITIRYLLLWILFVLSGLVFVVISQQPWMFVALLGLLLIGINAIIRRKDREKLIRSIFSLSLMGILILISVI